MVTCGGRAVRLAATQTEATGVPRRVKVERNVKRLKKPAGGRARFLCGDLDEAGWSLE